MKQNAPTEKEIYLAMCAQGGDRIPHLEHWSNPDAETYLTGIDCYEAPRSCRVRLAELYPMLRLRIPENDDPLPRPEMGPGIKTSDSGKHTVRWGAGESWSFEHGEKIFKTEEDVFAFSPLEKGDFSDWPFVVASGDYSSEEVLYKSTRTQYPDEWGDKAPEFSTATAYYYNTLFMWPLLTFGWEMFLATCLDERFARIMDEFSEISRRVFRAFSRLPINFCSCHDDLFMTNGPVCSREWMGKHIFPRYEEYWSLLGGKGIRVQLIADGKPDAYVDDLYSCGMRGLITEPYADFKAIAKKYPDIMLAGEGDNRILKYGTKDDIRNMVLSMVETGKMSGGYFMCIGNHIPWDVPGESLKYYFDYSDKYSIRG